MEILALILLVTPVLLPVMVAYGVDPIHFGVVLICCCAIGLSTPPLGENLFITSGIARISYEEGTIRALPMIFMNILLLILLVAFPQLALWLPNTLMPPIAPG
jgi:C4-dicarboxylate transporter DctM subunit